MTRNQIAVVIAVLLFGQIAATEAAIAQRIIPFTATAPTLFWGKWITIFDPLLDIAKEERADTYVLRVSYKCVYSLPAPYFYTMVDGEIRYKDLWGCSTTAAFREQIIIVTKGAVSVHFIAFPWTTSVDGTAMIRPIRTKKKPIKEPNDAISMNVVDMTWGSIKSLYMGE